MSVIFLLVIIAMLIIIRNIRIVPQSQTYVIERLGAYKESWGTGIHLKIPFIDRVANKISLKELVYDFPPQPVITSDNVTMQIDTVIFFQVTDAKLYTYGVTNPLNAIENLSATTLRNIIGELELDETLTSRDIINTKMRTILDEATDAWGIKVNRVELKNILPPKDIMNSMEKQMKAERERRESILQAEGQKTSAILVAEGEKQSAILKAEAEKQTTILRAEAEKEKQIREAEGKAEAILSIQRANAEGIRLINESKPSNEVLTIKTLEALEKVANGKATKIIIPSELQNLSGFVTAIKETVTEPIKLNEDKITDISNEKVIHKDIIKNDMLADEY
ncbi:MAG: Band7 family protein [Clostridiaceae bacterium]|jgi:regulator of protease activity HflC (stomatin/prohibitin superfamily)|nr:Band7 family protein [Clostridiaceae bacterium]